MPPTPRKLTTHQKAVLIHVLLAFPGQQVSVFYSPAADDALAYAHEFVTIFKSIEWNVKDPEPVEIAIPQSSGLAFIISRVPGLPTGAKPFATRCEFTESKSPPSAIPPATSRPARSSWPLAGRYERCIWQP